MEILGVDVCCKQYNSQDSNLVHDIVAYWSKRAEGYSQTNQEELSTKKRTIWQNLILSHAPKKEVLKVLDIGTGPGFIAITLALAGHDVTAVDVTQAMLDQAKKNADNYQVEINLVLSDVQSLPFVDNSFDLVVLRNVTWDLDKPLNGYKEWFRVLKKGGRLLNFDANWYLFLYDPSRYIEYQRDRNNTRSKNVADHYLLTDTIEMERIAKLLPLSQKIRPQWDVQVLIDLGFSKIYLETNISEQVWDQAELLNYHSTPMFMIRSEK